MLTLHNNLQDAFDDNSFLQPALLVRLERDGDSALRRTTHRHDLLFQTLSWTADSLVLGVEEIPQPSRYVAVNTRIILSGIDPLSQEAFHRQQAAIYLAYCRQSGIIGDPLLLFDGTMSVADIEESQGQVVQPLEIEGFWNRGSRGTTHARTDEGQRDRFAGDRAFREVARIREATIGGEGVHVFRTVVLLLLASKPLVLSTAAAFLGAI